MGTRNLFFQALKIDPKDSFSLRRFARSVGIPVDRLNYYNGRNKIPSGTDLLRICDTCGITEAKLMFKMGIFDQHMMSAIHKNADQVYQLIERQLVNNAEIPPFKDV